MRLLTLLLVPAALFAGTARYARLGEFDGKVEVQLHPADAWASAQRNLPLPEMTWVRTAPASKLEVEFEDGGALRLGPDSLAEFSDLTRLSTGQRVTLLSLDHGLAYYTGMPEGRDTLILAMPGAQVTFTRGARVRIEAGDQASQVAVLEGAVRFSSPAAEFDLSEGQTARVEPARTSRFFLYREVTPLELDRWNEQRDKILAVASSGRHLAVAYGAADLDAAGEWVQTEDLGPVWKPKVEVNWSPYRAGRWQWFDALGYTWISDEAWGWAPYHYGRWTRRENLGWVWAPPKTSVFKPAEVYWLRGAKIVGWGPLAPGEEWSPSAAPRQFLNANTTWAAYQAEARVIDPAGLSDRPKEPLGVAGFTLALPSPELVASRLEAVRPPLRAGPRVTPVISGVTYGGNPGELPPPPQPVAVVTNPTASEPPVVVVDSAPPPPPPVPVEVIYPVPVYTGVVVVNPPEERRGGWRRTGSGGGNSPAGSSSASSQSGQSSAPVPAPKPADSRPVTRTSSDEQRHREPPPSVTPSPAAEPRPTVVRVPASEQVHRTQPPAPAAPPAAPPAAKSESKPDKPDSTVVRSAEPVRGSRQQ